VFKVCLFVLAYVYGCFFFNYCFLNVVLTCLNIITLAHILFIIECSKKCILLYIEQDEETKSKYREHANLSGNVSIKKQNKSFLNHFLNGDINYDIILIFAFSGRHTELSYDIMVL
jgi:hypothetical protein